MRQLPQMNDLYEKYNGKGLHIIGLYAQDESIDDVRALVKDNNIKYPQALAWIDEEKNWSMPSLPMVWVIVTMFPSPSATAKCVVLALSPDLLSGGVNFEAFAASTRAACSFQ